jgi:hypothetical protein
MDNLSNLKFPQQVLLELSKADDPQEALSEANERKEAISTKKGGQYDRCNAGMASSRRLPKNVAG